MKDVKAEIKAYYDKDADLSHLKDRKLAVVGYGSQGHAHALNLKDSGMSVVVSELEGSEAWRRAKADGCQVMTTSEAVKASDIVVLLTQDNLQKGIFEREIAPNLKEGEALVVAHGFNVLYGQVVPPPNVDVFMVAPKSPGHIMRRQFKIGQGVPGLVAVHQDFTGKAWDVAKAYGKGVGCTRAGLIPTTFREETETDLFGEQAVLCGGVTELIRASFDTLVEAGYQPAVAYFECLHELKLIVDLIYEGGITLMRYSVSDTAEYGDITRGKRVINQDTRRIMREMLAEVQSGEFAREWILENAAGRPLFNTIVAKEKEHLIEVVGKQLRAMMPWIGEEK